MTSSLFISLGCSISVASIEVDVQMRKEVGVGNRRDFVGCRFYVEEQEHERRGHLVVLWKLNGKSPHPKACPKSCAMVM